MKCKLTKQQLHNALKRVKAEIGTNERYLSKTVFIEKMLRYELILEDMIEIMCVEEKMRHVKTVLNAN